MARQESLVRLRRLEESDCLRVRDWRNRPSVRRWMINDSIVSEAEHSTWFKSVMVSTHSEYWVVEMHGVPVGLTYLNDLSPENPSCRLGIYLAEAGVRGRGVGRAALEATVKRAFRDLGLTTMRSEVFAENERAVSLYTSTGFVQIDSEFVDSAQYGQRELLIMTLTR